MAAFNLKSFSRPELLKMVSPTRLIQFFRLFSEFFAARGLNLPSVGEPIDYEALISVLMTPDDPVAKAPANLIDALYVLDEMATESGMDALLRGAAERNLDLPRRDDQAPIDVAIEAWLLDAEFVQTTHAEQYLDHPRSFEYFPRASKTRTPAAKASSKVLGAIQTELDDWFEKHRRGRGSRVFVFPRDNSTWFLIRHGQPLRREGSIENGKPSSVVYRPERFDVLVHDHALDELRMNAQSKGEKSLYREVLGKYLFGDSGYFGTAAKYTLDPIRVNKRACLACDDVQGIEWIKLREVQFLWGGAENEIEVRKAADVFAAYESRNREMPQFPKIIKARFEVKFKDSKATRKVTVSAHNTQCVRDADTILIENWLTARGFAAGAEHDNDGGGEAVPQILVDDRVIAGFEDQLRRMGVSAGAGISVDLPAPSKHRKVGGGAPIAGASPK